MIAVDTSSLLAYLAGDSGPDVDLIDRALKDRQVCIPPVVLTEMLSDPRLPERVRRLLAELPCLSVENEYWQRAGLLRASLLSKKRKARLADVLIAQSCLDHDVILITRDRDFRSVANLGLRVAP